MASLALGLVGAGIGSLAPAGFTFLGMSGAGLGWAVGSALGNILFAPDGPNTQGPRLSDLSVQTSTRGAPIPTVYGTSRIAGNVIWSAGIKETSHTQEVGGKGGPSSSHTSYTYSCSFAVGLCEGEITGIRRIWADSVLIYNKGDTATADELTVSNQNGITVYTGSETQEPDPTIEAAEGVGNVPAYRGLAYVVFADLQLEKYGNRIPNITCEVVGSGSISPATWVLKDPQLGTKYVNDVAQGNGLIVAVSGNGEVSVSADSGDSWAVAGTTFGTDNIKCVHFYDGLFIAGTSNGKIATSPDGKSWTQQTNPYGKSYPRGARSITHGGGSWVCCGYDGYNNDILRSTDGVTWIISGKLTNDGPSYAVEYGDGVWVVAGANGNLKTSTDLITWVGRTSNFGVFDILSAAHNDGLWVISGESAKLATSPDGITWTIRSNPAPGLADISSVDADPGGGFIAFINRDQYYMRSPDGINWTLYDFVTGTDVTIYRAFYTPGRWVAGGIAHNTPSVGTVAVLPDDDLISLSSVTVSDIISDFSALAGVGSVDVSALSDTVHGYVRPSPMTARAAIEPLLSAYQIGASESDYTLKFKPLTGTPSETIDYSDLAADINITRALETELPRRVTLSYADKDADYLPAVQSAQRIKSVGQIVNEVSHQFAIATDGDHMAQLSEKILYRAWTERESFDWALTPKHAYLDAGDVVTLENTDSNHITRITSNGQQLPGLINCSGVATRASVYSSTLTGVDSGYAQQALVLIGNTLFEILDIPALRDADATSAGYYVAVYGQKANWTSGIVYKSIDSGASWSGLVSATVEATMGVTTNALPDADAKTWDMISTVNVSMSNGTLASDTVPNVLNGANAALIGNELIHFATATLETDGTYTLSGLLRGRIGTEHETASHATGDRFVLLNTTSIYRVSSEYSQKGVTNKFKAVTSGQYLESVTSTTDVTFDNLNAKPLSVCQISGARDGSNNLTINWIRRSRLSGVSLDDPALGEQSELYEVHAMDGAVVKRVIQASTNTTTYTASQQTLDGITPGDPITVNIYQVSATVGRGYVRSETL